MSQSSESILDHIAEMLRFISNTQSFWFTLDTSNNHGCHLANRFRLEPNDHEVLLVVAGLAHYTRFGFAMKPMAWSKFLGGHRFASDDCEIELNNEKIDLDTYIDGTPPSRLKRKKVYIVRIGNKTK
jgi:predicted oxidoreductase